MNSTFGDAQTHRQFLRTGLGLAAGGASGMGGAARAA
jgi:hypothetical protein